MYKRQRSTLSAGSTESCDVDDGLRCHICYEHYRRPKRLSGCTHSYCLACLRKVAAVAQNHRLIHCPLCRQEQALDSDGVDGLDTDDELDDKVRQLSCADCYKPCKTSKCTKCSAYCCDRCVKKHSGEPACEVLGQFRSLEQKLPNEKQMKEIEKMKIGWKKYKEDIPSISKHVENSFDKYIEILKQRKSELLTSLQMDKTLSERRLGQLKKLSDMTKSLEDKKLKITKTSTKTALTNLKQENEALNEMLDNTADILTYPPELKLCDNGLVTILENIGKFVHTKDSIDYSERTQVRRIIDSNFTEPCWDVAICPLSGNICATEKNHVRVHNKRGDFINRFYTGVFPARLTVNNKGQIIVGHFREHRVRVYDQQGEVLFEFGSLGEGDGHFRGPRAIYCDKDDNMYVADMHNHRIALHKYDGTFVKNIGQSVLAEPLGVALNSSGEMFVSDTQTNSIYKFDKNGIVMKRVSEADDRDITEPMGIWIDDQDNVLVCNNDTEKRIEIYNSELEYVGCLHDDNSPFRFLLGVVITNHKEILVSEYGKKRNNGFLDVVSCYLNSLRLYIVNS